MAESRDQAAACTCDPAGLPNVTDAQCPEHGVLAFLMSGAAAQPDDDPPAASAPPRWRNYEFDFPGYREAVEEQQRLLLAATEASKRLDVANEIVKEYEDKLRLAMENAMGECRVYAKEAAGVQ